MNKLAYSWEIYKEKYHVLTSSFRLRYNSPYVYGVTLVSISSLIFKYPHDGSIGIGRCLKTFSFYNKTNLFFFCR
jgi:hypothetical protein